MTARERVMARMKMIFTRNELERIWFIPTDMICIDLHGLSCFDARRFLNNVINILRNPEELQVIHGYNHGTALRDMIRKDLHNPHIIDIRTDERNYGITYLDVA